MPRISQEQAQERRSFLLDLFRSNPDISRQEALEAFEERFSSTINMKTFQELREQALKEQGSRGPAPEPEEEEVVEEAAEEPAPVLRMAPSQPEPALNGSSAHGSGYSNGMSNGASSSLSAQPKGRPAKGGARQKNVFVDAPKEHLDFLERVLLQLQEGGATNVRIDHSTERWMVLTVDAK
jgi:hypothetical protein